jgi:hypothetical protein
MQRMLLGKESVSQALQRSQRIVAERVREGNDGEP